MLPGMTAKIPLWPDSTAFLSLRSRNVMNGLGIKCLYRARQILVILLVSFLSVELIGCGPESKVPTGDPAENLRKLALSYVQFAGQNRGMGPKDKETLKQFMIRRNGVPEQEAEARFISPRDNEPYGIRWGMRPTKPGPTPADTPEPEIIIYEAVGADGTRYVADGRMNILEYTEEEFAKAVPDA